MFCQKCGSKLSEGAMFCPKCGTKLMSSEAAEQAQGSQPIQENDKRPMVEPSSDLYKKASPVMSGDVKATSSRTIEVNWKNQTPYDIVANVAKLLILDGIFGLVMRIVYTASEGLYFSTIVMAVCSLFLLLSGIIGQKVREEHEKLNLCFILFLIGVVTYVISLVIMWTEGYSEETLFGILFGIIVTVSVFLLYGVLMVRAYIYKRKGSPD